MATLTRPVWAVAIHGVTHQELADWQISPGTVVEIEYAIRAADIACILMPDEEGTFYKNRVRGLRELHTALDPAGQAELATLLAEDDKAMREYA